MSGEKRSRPYYIGWDVGGWNCDKNPRSRDAIAILDSSLSLIGQPWRGNLRERINEAETPGEWIKILFTLCGSKLPDNPHRVTLAIDTPLGFSSAFVRLVTELGHAGQIDSSKSNPYLFRYTERFLFKNGLTPLSAVKDMIGSQATKGMHVLAKLSSNILRCGVWGNGGELTIIESYPAGCKDSASIRKMKHAYISIKHIDIEDALTCGLIAYLFDQRPDELIKPDDAVPLSEGWIWLPKDAMK